MTAGARGTSIQRVLVTLDSWREGRALVDLAADLAASFEIPLTGIFVENQDMLEFAELPIASEITITGGRVQGLTRQRIQSHFRSQAVAVRKALESAAERQRINCTFEIRRGRIDVEIGAAARASDLIVFSPAAGPSGSPGTHDLIVHFESLAASGVVICRGRETVRKSNRVVTIYTGSKASQEAIGLAGRIAHRGHHDMMVVCLPSTEGRAMDETTASAGVEEISAEWVHMSEGTSVADYLGAIKPRLVVLPSDVPESERRMIVDVGLPVMILRL